MKAILVIDIPQTCKECELKYLDTGDDAYWGSNVERCIWDNCEIEHNERAYDCPLKPLPQKQKHHDEIDYDYGFIDGWNACIDAIIGDTDGTKGEK